jgi:hypothetical protein
MFRTQHVVAAVQQLAGMWPQGQFPGGLQPPPAAQHVFPAAGVFPLLHPPPGPPSPPPEGMPHVVSYNVLKPCKGRISKQSWLVDSGASVHLVNDLSLLHAPTVHAAPIPLQLATSDATGGITATGSICLLNQQSVTYFRIRPPVGYGSHVVFDHEGAYDSVCTCVRSFSHEPLS